MHEMNVDETCGLRCREEKRVSQPIPEILQMEFSEEFEGLDVPKDPGLGKTIGGVK
jgi:hypothetical protein